MYGIYRKCAAFWYTHVVGFKRWYPVPQTFLGHLVHAQAVCTLPSPHCIGRGCGLNLYLCSTAKFLIHGTDQIERALFEVWFVFWAQWHSNGKNRQTYEWCFSDVKEKIKLVLRYIFSFPEVQTFFTSGPTTDIQSREKMRYHRQCATQKTFLGVNDVLGGQWKGEA